MLLQQHGKLVALAFDWSKAFDSIIPASMCIALSRFGIPHDFIAMVNAIYTSRSFYVQCSSYDSTSRVQHAGICQGCSWSPCLCVIVMDMLMKDARSELNSHAGHLACNIHEILYADDILLVDEDGELAQFYMDIISKQGTHSGICSIGPNCSICRLDVILDLLV